MSTILHEVVASAETEIIGVDFVELNPLYDPADTTAINVAGFVTQFISSYFWKQSLLKKELGS